MEAEDRLRLDYAQTNDLIRTLIDVRFKLLALVPTIAGAAVGLLGSPGSAAELLAVGLLGLLATIGILTYELRNTQIFDAMLRHAKALERLIGLQDGAGAAGPDAVLDESAAEQGRLSASPRSHRTVRSDSCTGRRSPGGAISSRGARCARSASAVRARSVG